MNYEVSLKERKGILYAHYYEGSKLVKKSLRLKATKQNIAYAQKQIIPSLQGKTAKGERLFQENKISVFFERLMKRYENRSIGTQYAYNKGFSLFLEYFGDVNIASISVLDMDSYIEHLHKRISGKTIRLYLASVSLVFNEAIRLDIIHKNPVKYAIKPKIDTPQRRAYTVMQMWQLLDNANDRLKIFLYIGFLTGMRAGEILALTWDDVNMQNKTISITKSLGQYGLGKTKSRKDRQIPLINKLFEFLSTLDKKDGYIVGATRMTISSDLKKLCQSLGFFYEGTHNLRHTFASLMLQAKENPLLVKEFLGHTTLAMINTVYAHYIEDKDDCAKFGAVLAHGA